MKNLFFAMAVLLVTGVSQARQPIDVILEYKQAPIQGFSHRLTPTTYVQLVSDGRVLGTRCYKAGPEPRRCTRPTEVAKLNRYVLRTIDRLIERAEVGRVLDPNPNGMRCLAVPTTIREYTADNGSIVLESGTSPCGGLLINDTRAALELTQMMQKWISEYRRLRPVGISPIE